MTDSRRPDVTAEVPGALRLAGALSWRFLVVVGALWVIWRGFSYVGVAVWLPVAVALLLAALLSPAVEWLAARRVPRGLATAVVLVGGLALIGGLLTFVIQSFISGLPDLQQQFGRSIDVIRGWLRSGPFGLQPIELDALLNSALSWVERNQERLTSGALSTAAGVGEFITGMVLAIFTLIFFLHDGEKIWRFMVGLFPPRTRPHLDTAGRDGFGALAGFVRATALVAIFDAVFIGIGLWAVSAPLVVPLIMLIFLAAFIPIVGAVVSGVVAVLIVLVGTGPIQAVIVLGVVIAVQQIEGNVLQPILMGRAVKLHALAVVLAVAAGIAIAGIVGALIAVPLMAAGNAGIRSLTRSLHASSDEANGGTDTGSDTRTDRGPNDEHDNDGHDTDGVREPAASRDADELAITSDDDPKPASSS